MKNLSRAPGAGAGAALLRRAGSLSLACARCRRGPRRAHGRDLRSAARVVTYHTDRLPAGILRDCMSFSVPRAGIRTALPRARGAERGGGMAAVRGVSACWIEEGCELRESAPDERLRRDLMRPTPARVRIICSECS